MSLIEVEIEADHPVVEGLGRFVPTAQAGTGFYAIAKGFGSSAHREESKSPAGHLSVLALHRRTLVKVCDDDSSTSTWVEQIPGCDSFIVRQNSCSSKYPSPKASGQKPALPTAKACGLAAGYLLVINSVKF